jgi:hypothetical protein
MDDRPTLILWFSVYSLTCKGAPVITVRFALLFGGKIIAAEGTLVLFHSMVRSRGAETMVSMSRMSALNHDSA